VDGDGLRIRSMTADDYDAVIALWRVTEGIGLSAADEREAIAAYLERNPGLSRVAVRGGALVGAVMCGHDGRRGYLHHLAVVPAERGRGLGRELAERCLDDLRALGIGKVNIFVYADNEEGQAFWRATGWVGRDDLLLMQRSLEALDPPDRPRAAC
jgi:ribosomal protein S18 acetylase RimI-like enzyme